MRKYVFIVGSIVTMYLLNNVSQNITALIVIYIYILNIYKNIQLPYTVDFFRDGHNSSLSQFFVQKVDKHQGTRT